MTRPTRFPNANLVARVIWHPLWCGGWLAAALGCVWYWAAESRPLFAVVHAVSAVMWGDHLRYGLNARRRITDTNVRTGRWTDR